VLSREEEEQLAREKKEKLDEIKNKYNQVAKRTRSGSRRIISAKASDA